LGPPGLLRANNLRSNNNNNNNNMLRLLKQYDERRMDPRPGLGLGLGLGLGNNNNNNNSECLKLSPCFNDPPGVKIELERLRQRREIILSVQSWYTRLLQAADVDALTRLLSDSNRRCIDTQVVRAVDDMRRVLEELKKTRLPQLYDKMQLTMSQIEKEQLQYRVFTDGKDGSEVVLKPENEAHITQLLMADRLNYDGYPLLSSLGVANTTLRRTYYAPEREPYDCVELNDTFNDLWYIPLRDAFVACYDCLTGGYPVNIEFQFRGGTIEGFRVVETPTSSGAAIQLGAGLAEPLREMALALATGKKLSSPSSYHSSPSSASKTSDVEEKELLTGGGGGSGSRRRGRTRPTSTTSGGRDGRGGRSSGGVRSSGGGGRRSSSGGGGGRSSSGGGGRSSSSGCGGGGGRSSRGRGGGRMN